MGEAGHVMSSGGSAFSVASGIAKGSEPEFMDAESMMYAEEASLRKKIILVHERQQYRAMVVGEIPVDFVGGSAISVTWCRDLESLISYRSMQ